MSVTTARNVAIVLALAALVAFLPGGGTTAAIVARVLSTLILVVLRAVRARFYREHRVDIDALGDRWRGLLYGAVGADRARDGRAAAPARHRGRHAGRGRAVAGGRYALYPVWRHYREYA